MSLKEQIAEVGQIAQDLKTAVFTVATDVITELANRLGDLAVKMGDALENGDPPEDAPDPVPEEVPVEEIQPEEPPPAPEAEAPAGRRVRS